jgi:hypothetical protein
MTGRHQSPTPACGYSPSVPVPIAPSRARSSDHRCMHLYANRGCAGDGRSRAHLWGGRETESRHAATPQGHAPRHCICLFVLRLVRLPAASPTSDAWLWSMRNRPPHRTTLPPWGAVPLAATTARPCPQCHGPHRHLRAPLQASGAEEGGGRAEGAGDRDYAVTAPPPANGDRKSAIITSTSRKRLKLLRVEARSAERDEHPEKAAEMGAWLERAKWGHGPSR